MSSQKSTQKQRKAELPSEHLHDEEEGEPWLISYSDLMTLLFGLFVMLFSTVDFSALEKSKEHVRVRGEIAKFFGGVDIAKTNPAESVPEPKREDEKKTFVDQVQNDLVHMPKLENTQFTVSKDGMEIMLVSRVFFEAGRAELAPEAKKPFHVLAEHLKSLGLSYRVRVEGHTDDEPISSPQFPSNWELSSARASAIVRELEAQGVPAAYLSATGFGSAQPLYPNRDEKKNRIPANQERNRRVTLKVLFN